jgi:predicted TPR repeat methyltransferase
MPANPDTTDRRENREMEPSAHDEARRLFYLGVERQSQGKLPEAEEFFSQSLSLMPDRPSTLANLYIVRVLQNKHEAALPLIERALELNPKNEVTWIHKAMWMSDKGRFDEALSCCDQAVSINPGSIDAHYNRACALMKMKRLEEALSAFDRTLAIKPDHATAHQHRGNVLHGLGRNEEAVASFRSALANGLDSEEVHYLLAALGAEAVPPAAPRGLVASLFDNYADVFDEHLTSLGYEGPRLIFDAVSFAVPPGGWDIADLGCGTGLCGPLFWPIARRLAGVDLSANMIEKARTRQSYDELVQGDIIEFLDARAASFDLAIAADVFVYIGDLDPVFRSVRQALRPGGRFAFSVETHEGAGFVLQPTQHFAHSLSYVRECVANHGFIEDAVMPIVVRKHKGSDTNGAIVVLSLQD